MPQNSPPHDIDVFIFNLKKRHSGVSTTIFSLLPPLSEQLSIAYVSNHAINTDKYLPSGCKQLTLWQTIKHCRSRLPRGGRHLWHLRRNKEMLIAVLCRDVLRLPIRLVFTSAAIRRHSAFPRWLIRRMDAVVATSQEAANCLKSCRKVIEHGVDTQHFTPPIDSSDCQPQQLLAAKHAAWQSLKNGGDFGIGIVGRVREEKGIHLFVEAMISLLPKHPKYTAFIAGLCKSSDQDYLQSLQQRVIDARLEDRLLFLGAIPPETIPSFYRASLITVACPLYEGFGLTILEAMASASAVIASRTGAFPRLISPGKNGHLVDIDDVASLEAALDDLMSQPEKAAAWGMEGVARARQHHSCQKEAQELLEVYEVYPEVC